MRTSSKPPTRPLKPQISPPRPDLRHTFATLMLEQGENPKVVQEVLGHSRITHTMDTYSHVSPNIQKEAFGRLGKRLEGP
jgi:integrase